MSRTQTAAAYVSLVVLVVAFLALALTPVSRSLVEQWSERDVQSRSQLIYDSVQMPVARAMAEGDFARLTTLFDDVAHDDRVLAVGLCDDGRLVAAGRPMPRSFACPTGGAVRRFANIMNAGRPVLVGTFPLTAGDGKAYLVVLHDLGFIKGRLDAVQGLSLGVLAATALIVALAAGVGAGLMLSGWTTSLRQAVARARSGKTTPRTQAGGSFMEAEIRTILNDLQVGRTPTEAPEMEWTPKALQDLLRDATPGAEVIILSNREPYIHNKGEGGAIELQTPASGLVSALEPVMRAVGGVWVAHGSGTADRETADSRDRVRVPPSHPEYTLRRVWISEEEQDGYYYGLANEGLWPLCHIAFVRPTFRESDWRAYELVNRRFADAVVQEATTEDPIVLVQDYHFALAPKMIREKLPKATIITFWHIPWPNAETFGICPWKEQVIEGLLGSTILGFHTQFHCNNFLETVDRVMESRIDRERSSVSLGGHETLVRAYPISIEWPPKAMRGQAPIAVCRERVRERHGLDPEMKIAVGIERFDYTKGILDRMQAVDTLLQTHPEWLGRFTFIQAAAPTRSKLPAYGRLQREAVELAEEINARHGADGYKPVRLVIRHHEPHEVFELFRAADLCVVSSLHDGMNLVAKEFVAARDDEEGVLVLSSFTGASRELAEALIMNPYNPAEVAEAFDRALRMPLGEQHERMRLMRQHVQEQNVYRWAARIMVDAARTRQHQRILDLADTAA